MLGDGGLPSRLATPGGVGSLPLLTALKALGEAHGWPTWRPGALPNVLAFIDACEPNELGTGADTEHPDLLEPDAERAAIEDLGAVVHATGASTGPCQVQMDYGAEGTFLQGALGQAAMNMLFKAGGYEWSHDDLLAAIQAELVQAEVDVDLHLVAPTSEPERPVLRTRDEYWFDRSVQGEVYPTSDMTAAQFELVADDGAFLGVMVITGTAQKAALIHPSWYDAGFDRDTLYFRWAPGVAPFSQSFTAIPPLENGKLLQTMAMDEPIGADAPALDDADVYPQRYWFPLTKPMTGFQPTFRMVAGGKVQKWLQIKTSTIKGRTVNDLVFYRHEDQPSETDPLLELRFERLPAGTVIDSPIHMIAQEPQQ